MPDAELENQPQQNRPRPAWLRSDLHADFANRAVWYSEHQQWQATQSAGVSVKPIEIVGGLARPRFTALLKMEPESEYQLRYHDSGTELLVLDGELDCPDNLSSRHPTTKLGRADSGQYLRYPIGSGEVPRSARGCTLFMKAGQISEQDKAYRQIETRPHDHWLPGPAAGTEVLPLHVHGSKSVLMIRWLETVSFRPQLDPQGEELFVVSGLLHDDSGSYPSGTWIRNPVPTWQNWGGQAGTAIYYKNGHFPD